MRPGGTVVGRKWVAAISPVRLRIRSHTVLGSRDVCVRVRVASLYANKCMGVSG